jgi:hypothetical protein
VAGGAGGAAVAVVTGQTVVLVKTVWVLDPTGQLVTVGGQERMVYSTVLYTVEVVYGTAEVMVAVAVAAEDSDSSTGQMVV